MKVILIWAFLLAAAATTYSQATSSQACPADLVCISREAARKALEDADVRKALEAKAKIDEQAINDLKTELENMRREVVRFSTEASDLRQDKVHDRAIIELLLKNTKRKCYPFSVCIGG